MGHEPYILKLLAAGDKEVWAITDSQYSLYLHDCVAYTPPHKKEVLIKTMHPPSLFKGLKKT